MPKALIVGGGGFLGTHLTRRLLKDDWQLSHLMFRSRPGREVPAGVETIYADAQPDSIRQSLEKRSFDVVFSLAAAGVEPGQRSASNLFEGNIMLPAALAEALSPNPPGRVIHAGSCAEYSPFEGQPFVSEAASCGGADLYGSSKAAGGLWAAALARAQGFSWVHLRLFHMFGMNEAPHRLVSSLFRQLLSGQPVKLSPGAQVRDLLYVEDVVSALLAAAFMRKEALGDGIFNVCSSVPATVAEVARTTARVVGRDEKLLCFGALDYRPGELMWLVGDNAKFRAASGWTQVWNLEAGLTTMKMEP